MTDITSLSKWEILKGLFWDWCRWNVRDMDEREFVSRYGMNPRTVRKLYLKNPVHGVILQDVWLEFIKKRREK